MIYTQVPRENHFPLILLHSPSRKIPFFCCYKRSQGSCLLSVAWGNPSPWLVTALQCGWLVLMFALFQIAHVMQWYKDKAKKREISYKLLERVLLISLLFFTSVLSSGPFRALCKKKKQQKKKDRRKKEKALILITVVLFNITFLLMVKCWIWIRSNKII